MYHYYFYMKLLCTNLQKKTRNCHNTIALTKRFSRWTCEFIGFKKPQSRVRWSFSHKYIDFELRRGIERNFHKYMHTTDFGSRLLCSMYLGRKKVKHVHFFRTFSRTNPLIPDSQMFTIPK